MCWCEVGIGVIVACLPDVARLVFGAASRLPLERARIVDGDFPYVSARVGALDTGAPVGK